MGPFGRTDASLPWPTGAAFGVRRSSAQIAAGGDLSTSGDLHFEAVEVFQQPCVRIGGNLSTEGHLSFTNCHSTEVTEVRGAAGGGAVGFRGTVALGNILSVRAVAV